MKIPEILLVETVHQGRTLVEIAVEIDEPAIPDCCSRRDKLPIVQHGAAVLALSGIGPVARNFYPIQ